MDTCLILRALERRPADRPSPASNRSENSSMNHHVENRAVEEPVIFCEMVNGVGCGVEEW
jgi:hypothetical protein